MNKPSFEAIPIPKQETATIKIRPLEPEETSRIFPVLERLGWKIPYPAAAAVVAAEADGEIVGFGITQMIPHAEPLWVHTAWRGRGIAELLTAEMAKTMLDNNIPYWVCVAPDKIIEDLCRAQGMKEIKGKLFVKD